MLSFQTSLQSVFLSTGSLFGEESDSAKIDMLWFLFIPINQLESDETSDKQTLIFNLNYLFKYLKKENFRSPIIHGQLDWLWVIYLFMGWIVIFIFFSKNDQIHQPIVLPGLLWLRKMSQLHYGSFDYKRTVLTNKWI